MTIDYPDIDKAARNFISSTKGCKVFAFHGEMGVGKTTFIKAICREMGVREVINSPTFAIVNEYRVEATGEPVYHFDFYRVNHIWEAEDLGLSDYFFSGALCFIEWPEKIEGLMPEDTTHVFLRENADGSREFDIHTEI
ncbi:MAG: tRNA (adenosine(37)-N6)-threonylcarbamoyltransferase complex ATPase subunit type 1 TsaE [Tannerellaceae bacterium]|jgi:tRNA threonylcarbamoyladenosine biosynthesis protein TsaE|nr:tRNA (adenosine(37)-N6)-threonylcarbamoyltransferase complex ATPase subunit type 1 TsaE [Tannerellaceae bacterium]